MNMMYVNYHISFIGSGNGIAASAEGTAVVFHGLRE